MVTSNLLRATSPGASQTNIRAASLWYYSSILQVASPNIRICVFSNRCTVQVGVAEQESWFLWKRYDRNKKTGIWRIPAGIINLVIQCSAVGLWAFQQSNCYKRVSIKKLLRLLLRMNFLPMVFICKFWAGCFISKVKTLSTSEGMSIICGDPQRMSLR